MIGFGPSGAVLAGLLGQAGITTLAIDKTAEIYPKPRAIAVDHEIMRLFDNMGVAGEVLPHTAPFTASEHFGAEGQLIRRIDMVPAPYPMGYVPSMVFTQPPVEQALRTHVAGFECVEVALGTAAERLEQDADGVTLHLRTPEGAERVVRAGYVIGCDGASSLVRKQMGIALEDLVFDEPWLVIDVLLNLEAASKLPDKARQYCEPQRPTTYLLGPGLHRRWEIMLLPGEDRFAMEHPDAVWNLLARWISPADGTLWRATSYRFHALLAEEWRRGRVFIAGDAAHQQPPFIGQGMCQGLRDVSNLAWKLISVLRGEADASLLDSYAVERGAHVRELTGRIKAIGHVICERDPEVARARDARILAEGGGVARTITRQEIVPKLSVGLLSASGHPAVGSLFPQPMVRGGGAMKLLDQVVGVGWRLIVDGRHGSSADVAGVTVVTIGPDHLAECDGVVAYWFDVHGVAAALVRPDHYVFGVGTSVGAAAALVHEMTQAIGG